VVFPSIECAEVLAAGCAIGAAGSLAGALCESLSSTGCEGDAVGRLSSPV